MNKDKIEEFVDYADKISQQVKDIISGKLSPEEFDRLEREEQQMSESKKKLEEDAKINLLLKGRPGKGHKPGYEWYCPRCQHEYLVKEMKKCFHCSFAEMQTYDVSVFAAFQFRFIQIVLECSENIRLLALFV